MKNRLIGLLAGLAIALLTAGCDQAPKPEVVQVEKTKYDQLVKERADFKARAETAEKQKVEVVQGMSPESCTAMAKDIVADSCTAKASSGKATASRSSQKRHLSPARSQSTATATARGNATATATATAGGVSTQVTPSADIVRNEQSAPSTGAIWLWHAPYATSKAPEACVIESGDGRGLPPYCSTHSVKQKLALETKNQWLVRVGGGHRPTDTGLYQKQ